MDSIACHAPLSMGFPMQEYCSGLLFPSPGNLPNPGIKPATPALAGEFFTTESESLPHLIYSIMLGGSLPLNHQGSPTSTTLHIKTFFFFLIPGVLIRKQRW